MLLVANSTPIVDFDSKLNSLRVNRDKRLLLPTPESPINTTEIWVGYFCQTWFTLALRILLCKIVKHGNKEQGSPGVEYVLEGVKK